MYSEPVRRGMRAALASGVGMSELSRISGVSRSTLRSWLVARPAVDECFRCEDLHPTSAGDYSALLGYYLGDGCVSDYRGKHLLRVSCDKTLPGIIDDVSRLIVRVHPTGKVWHVAAPGVVVIQSNWKHWPCLFPQHGPGRKHERPIMLEIWQREVAEVFPGDFLRGLFHSDGCRVTNRVTRLVGGHRKSYEYGRWQFVNASDHIRNLCTWALDLVSVAWRQSAERVISVSRREAVARLDELIGPKA